MIRTTISPGVYEGPSGVFWSRPFIRGRRTWRKLRAIKAAAAVKENALTDWNAPGGTFAELAQLYLAAGCPNKRLEARTDDFHEAETARVNMLIAHFGPRTAEELRIADLPRYKAWRIKRLRTGTGERTVDKDVQTLSNVLNYGVAVGQLEMNYIRAGRPRFQRASQVRHANQVAPPDAEAIHRLADELMGSVRSEVLAWQLLFGALTGCRTSELRRLRIDASTPEQPGHFVKLEKPVQCYGEVIGHLFLKRSKNGVNPWALVWPELAECLECFHNWHAARFPKNPFYFPSVTGKLDKTKTEFVGANQLPIDATALNHALTRACSDLNLPHITPHGLRSFYVTKRRSDGAPDAVIAGEIGDQTVSLMQTTYGARPANWTGGDPLSWKPNKDGRLAAWLRWQTPEAKIIGLPIGLRR